MQIVFTILLYALIVLLALLLVLLVFCIVPLRYIFDISYKENTFNLKFKFCIIKFELCIELGTPLRYKAQIMHKIIADSENKKNNEKSKDSSIAETDFIEDKDLESSVTIEKTVTKEILKRAEEYNKEISADDNKDKKIKGIDDIKNKIFSFIDSFKNILPKSIIDVAKLITREWCKYYKNLMPKKVTTNTEFGIDDPYSVGLILGFISPLYAVYGNSIKVVPHFDKNMLDLDVKIIGRPQIIFIAIPVINLLFDKRFREVFFKGKDTKKDII